MEYLQAEHLDFRDFGCGFVAATQRKNIIALVSALNNYLPQFRAILHALFSMFRFDLFLF